MMQRATVGLLTAGQVSEFESLYNNDDIDGGLAALHAPFQGGAACVAVVKIDGRPVQVVHRGDVPSSIAEAGRITAGMTVTVHRNAMRAWRTFVAGSEQTTQ
jgi:hypothetical protein